MEVLYSIRPGLNSNNEIWYIDHLLSVVHKWQSSSSGSFTSYRDIYRRDFRVKLTVF